MSGPIEDGKNETVGRIVAGAANNPDIKEAGRILGKSALTVAKTIEVCLLPLAALNFGVQKAREYFANEFAEDLNAKTASIPLEDIVEPKASVAGPALQGLAFTHEEPDLKEMFLTLLATAMDRKVASEAHPAFVEIIKQMSSQEAEILKSALQAATDIPIAEIRISFSDERFQTIYRHLIQIANTATGKLTVIAQMPTFIDNWTRLGIVWTDYDSRMAASDAYKWVEDRPEFRNLKQKHERDNNRVVAVHGRLVRTSFGLQFAKAVGLTVNRQPPVAMRPKNVQS